jgi:hypothetical protein
VYCEKLSSSLADSSKLFPALAKCMRNMYNCSRKASFGEGKGNSGEQNAAEALAAKGNKREQEAGKNHGRRQKGTRGLAPVVDAVSLSSLSAGALRQSVEGRSVGLAMTPERASSAFGSVVSR